MQLTTSIDLDSGQSGSLAKLLAIPRLPTQLTLVIQFQIVGSYLPATLDTPAEYPELEFDDFSSATAEFWDEGSNRTYLVDAPQVKLTQIQYLLTPANYSLIEQLAFELAEDSHDNA